MHSVGDVGRSRARGADSAGLGLAARGFGLWVSLTALPRRLCDTLKSLVVEADDVGNKATKSRDVDKALGKSYASWLASEA